MKRVERTALVKLDLGLPEYGWREMGGRFGSG